MTVGYISFVGWMFEFCLRNIKMMMSKFTEINGG